LARLYQHPIYRRWAFPVFHSERVDTARVLTASCKLSIPSLTVIDTQGKVQSSVDGGSGGNCRARGLRRCLLGSACIRYPTCPSVFSIRTWQCLDIQHVEGVQGLHVHRSQVVDCESLLHPATIPLFLDSSGSVHVTRRFTLRPQAIRRSLVHAALHSVRSNAPLYHAATASASTSWPGPLIPAA